MFIKEEGVEPLKKDWFERIEMYENAQPSDYSIFTEMLAFASLETDFKCKMIFKKRFRQDKLWSKLDDNQKIILLDGLNETQQLALEYATAADSKIITDVFFDYKLYDNSECLKKFVDKDFLLNSAKPAQLEKLFNVAGVDTIRAKIYNNLNYENDALRKVAVKFFSEKEDDSLYCAPAFYKNFEKHINSFTKEEMGNTIYKLCVEMGSSLNFILKANGGRDTREKMRVGRGF